MLVAKCVFYKHGVASKAYSYAMPEKLLEELKEDDFVVVTNSRSVYSVVKFIGVINDATEDDIKIATQRIVCKVNDEEDEEKVEKNTSVISLSFEKVEEE